MPTTTTTTTTHSQPGGRAIHPECANLDRTENVCTCDESWGFSFGELHIAALAAERAALRTRAEGSTPKLDGSEADSPARLNYDGFWKHSEFLNCCAGVPLQPLSNYSVGPTWERARLSEERQ